MTGGNVGNILDALCEGEGERMYVNECICMWVYVYCVLRCVSKCVRVLCCVCACDSECRH